MTTVTTAKIPIEGGSKTVALYPETHKVLVSDSGIAFASATTRKLSPKEFELFSMLVARAGFVMSHESIMFGLYGKEFVTDSVRVFICHLRAAFGAFFPVESVWGRGYRVGVPARAPVPQPHSVHIVGDANISASNRIFEKHKKAIARLATSGTYTHAEIVSWFPDMQLEELYEWEDLL